MKDEITKLVSDRQHVTFAEFSKEIKGFNGELTMALSEDPNMVLWHGISKAALQVLLDLIKDKIVYTHVASILIYLVDGRRLTLPVAVRPPKAGYKEPHWVPVCFCTYPMK